MIITANGLGDAGCPITPQGDCVLNGMPVSCSLIRECDSQTGTLHYEYATPGGSSKNVNINVANPATQQIIGYNNAQGNFVDTTDVPITSLTNRPTAASIQQKIVDAQGYAARNAATQGYTGPVAASYIAQYLANVAANLNADTAVNTQAGSVTGAIVNTPQTTTSQQGNPAYTTTTNANAGTGTTGNGSFTSSIGDNFSSLVAAGSNWFSGTTYGIPNTALAIGGAIAIAIAGGYVGGTRRGR